MDNRKKLVNYLNKRLDILADDPLYHTKQFLIKHHIPTNDFFNWIVTEASRFNFVVNSDKGVRNLLQ